MRSSVFIGNLDQTIIDSGVKSRVKTTDEEITESEFVTMIMGKTAALINRSGDVTKS